MDSTPSQSPLYLKIRCPSEICQHDMVLACPYCQKGALKSSEEGQGLLCNHCHSSIKAISCDCGFTIKASYIAAKQRKLEEMLRHTDSGAYIAIAGAFITFGGMGYILALLLG